MMKKIFSSKNLYILFFLFLSVIILWKMLLPGYIFTADMVFGPNYPIPDEAPIHSIPYHYLISVLHNVLDGSIIQKLLFLFFFTFSGVAMYKTVPVKSEYAKYFAGILYIINPFVYVRFFAGQFTILLAFAFLPFVVKAIFYLFENDEKIFKSSLFLVLWLTVIGIFSEHFLYMSLFVFGAVSVFRLISHHKDWKSILKKIGAAMGLFLVLNSWWIYTYFIYNPVAGFDITHFESFKTAPDFVFGVFFNVLAMYGFWWELAQQGTYVVWAKDIIPGWYIFFSFIFAFVLYGIAVGLGDKKHKFKIVSLSIISVFAIIFSMGIASSFSEPINRFLYDYMPFFKGFRDSQKWSALLILAYCYFGAFAMNHMLKGLSQFAQKVVLYICCIVVVVYTFPMIGGFGGQLKPVQYPESWNEINEILENDESSKALFLPWHMYMSFEFNNNRLSSVPAKQFFDKPILVGDNMEVESLYSSSIRPSSTKVESFLSGDQSQNNFRNLIKDLDVSHIIYMSDTEEVEEIDYSFLFNSPLLNLKFQEDTTFLFEINRELQ